MIVKLGDSKGLFMVLGLKFRLFRLTVARAVGEVCKLERLSEFVEWGF